MNWNTKARNLLISAVGALLVSSVAYAQPRSSGVIGDVVPRDNLQERIPVPADKAETKAVAAQECQSDWGTRLSPGVTVWFFDDENTSVGPALYGDIWDTCLPLNFRVGIEGRHLYLGQDAAFGSRETPDQTTHVTYIRIPFALEYAMEVADATTLYVGGGPDLINTVNDVSDFAVGGHLGARVHYAFDANWGVSVEAGYMWAEVEGRDGADINLDGAYITPLLAYTF